MRQFILRRVGRCTREGRAFSKSSKSWASKMHLTAREKSKQRVLNSHMFYKSDTESPMICTLMYVKPLFSYCGHGFSLLREELRVHLPYGVFMWSSSSRREWALPISWPSQTLHIHVSSASRLSLFTISLSRAMTACLHYISSCSPNIPGPHVAQTLSSNCCGRRESWEGKKGNSKFYF